MENNEYIEKLKASVDGDWRDPLWNAIAAFQGETFVTSGRGPRPGVTFTYSIKRYLKPESEIRLTDSGKK